MSASHRPTLATWLLERLGSGPTHEALAGDLIEQYRQGRSGAWYWRQVLVAIIVGAANDIGAHKLLALRALVSGWVVREILRFPADPLAHWLRNWTVDNGHDTVRAVLLFSGPGQFQLPSMIVLCLSAAAAGWIVARLHRSHRRAMVLLFASFLVLVNAPPFLYMTISPWMRVGFGGFSALVIPAIFLFIAEPVSTLVGGLWSAPAEAARDVDHHPASL